VNLQKLATTSRWDDVIKSIFLDIYSSVGARPAGCDHFTTPCVRSLGLKLFSDFFGNRKLWRLVPTIFCLTPILALPLTASSENLTSKDHLIDEIPNPYAKDYLSLGIVRNYPASFSQNTLKSGYYHPYFAYQHNLNRSWLVGVGFQFKVLRKQDHILSETATNNLLAFWSLTHETYYSLRLHHPHYLLLGPKLLYLLPAQRAKFPILRDGEFATEFGIAFSLKLVHILFDKSTIAFRIDRWRGTKSQKFHGLEVGFDYGYALD
jgi:hypothetical protein